MKTYDERLLKRGLAELNQPSPWIDVKIITEEDYRKMSKEEQDKHHAKVREELIKVGLIKPSK